MNILGFNIGRRRKFAQFTPTVITEEVIEDGNDLTVHPIEDGAVITDHIIAQPTTVMLEAYFSFEALVGKTPEDIYREILDFKNTGEPFEVITGKRTLENMLFKSIRCETNVDTEYVLHLTLEMQQVNLVTLKEVKLRPKDEPSSIQNAGKKQAQATDKAAGEAAKEAAKKNSALYSIIYG